MQNTDIMQMNYFASKSTLLYEHRKKCDLKSDNDIYTSIKNIFLL